MTIEELKALLTEDGSEEALSLLKSIDSTSGKITKLGDAKIFFSANSVQVHLLNKMITNEYDKIELATVESGSGEKLNSDEGGSSGDSGLDLTDLV